MISKTHCQSRNLSDRTYWRASAAGGGPGNKPALGAYARKAKVFALVIITGGLLIAKAYAQAAPATTPVPGAPPSSAGVPPTAPAPAPGHVSYTSNPFVNGPGNPSVKLQASPIGKQQSPELVMSPSEVKTLEKTPPALEVIQHQWSLTDVIPSESIFSYAYMKTRDTSTRSLSLKEALYLALRNNPGVAAASLDPVASLQGVRGSWAVFDPDLVGQLEVTKIAIPAASSLLTGGPETYVQKMYAWNFGANKTLAMTNGTLGASFTNSYYWNNSPFSFVNPSYNPTIELSLNQPLLRNFGNQFATINVRIAQENQKAAQYRYEQQLNDFVLKVGTDYWNVVRAEMNLQVANQALEVANDLVRDNKISLKVGWIAPIDLKESQSEAATNLSNVAQAQGATRCRSRHAARGRDVQS